MIITEVRSRRKRQVQLYLDGEAAVRIAEEVWERSALRPGDEIDDDRLKELLEESGRYMAREKALWLLEYRQHSKKELEDKISRTLPRQAAREAVAKMEELGLTDDAGFAAEYARMLVDRKGYAPRRAIYELGLKGIDRDTAQNAVDALQVDVTENILRITERKYPRLAEDEKEYNRAVQTLQRLGYSYDQIRKALGEREENRN